MLYVCDDVMHPRCLSLVMEDVNEGRTPDVGNFAAQAGLETDEAWEIYNTIMEKFNGMGKTGQ